MYENKTLVRIIKSFANEEGMSPEKFANAKYDPSVARLVEKSVMSSASLQDDSDWRAAQRAFLELARARSLIGKIQAVSSFRKIPLNVPVLKQTQAAQSTWIKEAEVIGVGSLSLERAENKSRKLATIVPVTKELMAGVGADFESALNSDLVRAIAVLEGESFIDPANAGIPDTSPASVLYGVTPIASDSDAKADLAALVQSFSGDIEYAVFVMRPETAVTLAAQGFEGVGVRGGEIAGIPVVTSNSVPTGVVALIDPSGILLSDDGVELSVSNETTLQIGVDSNDDPIIISLYQENLAAIRALRYLNWQVVRDGAAAYLSGVAWV